MGDDKSQEIVVVFCTAPVGCSDSIARAVVDEQLCACVSILPSVRSVFRWQGKVDVADEHLMVAKTTLAASGSLQDRLVALHPYDVPEVIILPVAAGLPTYLSWVADSVRA